MGCQFHSALPLDVLIPLYLQMLGLAKKETSFLSLSASCFIAAFFFFLFTIEKN